MKFLSFIVINQLKCDATWYLPGLFSDIMCNCAVFYVDVTGRTIKYYLGIKFRHADNSVIQTSFVAK